MKTLDEDNISYISCNKNKCTIYFTNKVWHGNNKRGFYKKINLKKAESFTKVVCDDNKCKEINAKMKYIGNNRSGFYREQKMGGPIIHNKNSTQYNNYINMIMKSNKVVTNVTNDYIRHTIIFRKMENLSVGTITSIILCHDGGGCTEMDADKNFVAGFYSNSFETSNFYNMIESYNISNSENSN